MQQSAPKGLGEHRLGQPLALEDGKPPRVLSTTLYSLSAFVLCGIAWASLTEIREMTPAPGQIVPRGQVNYLQHLEGGIVAEIFVRDGATVQSGDPILRLAPAQTQSELQQAQARAASLKLIVTRIDAQSKGTTPDFSPFADTYPSLVREQTNVFLSDASQHKRERDTLNAKLRQRESEAKARRDEAAVAVRQAEVQRSQLEIQQTLIKQGYASKKTYLDALAAFERAQAELVAVQGRLATALEAETEGRNQINEHEATYQRKMADERAKAANDLAETEASLAKFTDRLERLLVRAPANGVVMEMMPRSVGEVVRPGDILARIVPQGAELIAEVRIDPKDIGHMRPGATADVKFSTFDPATYGSIRGTVEAIAATTTVAMPGQPNPGLMPNSPEPYYKAVVRLDKATIGDGKLQRPVVPGMVVTAEIVTGAKSLTRYMLKPVFRSLDVAFTER